MNYSLKHLHALVAVARHGSFAAAAQALRVTRPSLSVLIRELEERVGFAVFKRTTRTVALTEEGRAFLPYAERVLAEYQESIWAARQMSPHGRGVLRIASSQLMAGVLLPDAIREFQARGGRSDFRLLDLSNDEVIDAVLRGDAELGIGPERFVPDSISARVLFKSPLGCMCAADHAFAQAGATTWNEMAAQTIISNDRGGWLMVMRDLNYEMRFVPTIEVHSAISAMALVSRNLGVMISTAFVGPLLPPFNVRLVPLMDPVIERCTMLYTRNEARLSPEVQSFIEVLLRLPPPATLESLQNP